MVIDILLLLTLVICVITDLKSRKIYNMVIFPGLALAIMLHLILGGWQGLGFSLLGFVVGFGLLLIPYFLGGMGAGDVKLLALIGAMKGTYFVLYTALYMGLIGGGIALAILLFRRGIMQRLKAIIYSLYCFRYGIRLPMLNKEDMKTSYPYGVAIAGGALLCMWL